MRRGSSRTRISKIQLSYQAGSRDRAVSGRPGWMPIPWITVLQRRKQWTVFRYGLQEVFLQAWPASFSVLLLYYVQYVSLSCPSCWRSVLQCFSLLPWVFLPVLYDRHGKPAILTAPAAATRLLPMGHRSDYALSPAGRERTYTSGRVQASGRSVQCQISRADKSCILAGCSRGYLCMGPVRTCLEETDIRIPGRFQEDITDGDNPSANHINIRIKDS